MCARQVTKYIPVVVEGNIFAHPIRAGRPAPTLRWARMCARQVPNKFLPCVEGDKPANLFERAAHTFVVADGLNRQRSVTQFALYNRLSFILNNRHV